MRSRLIGLTVAMALGLVACGSGASDDMRAEVVENYADLVHESYQISLDSATTMDEAIDAFVADPNAETLAAAQDAWLTARDDYGPTEAFRFYGGPIDDEENGVEGLLNAWPLDEAYIDYVDGSPDAGVINLPDEYPTIDADLLVSLNEQGGEANISTGWHAIEFLLWGQDLSTDGAGTRPVEDYTTGTNADRRAAYLTVASDLLLTHLGQMVDAWAPEGDNYRVEFLALPAGRGTGHDHDRNGRDEPGRAGRGADDRGLRGPLPGGRALLLLRQHDQRHHRERLWCRAWCTWARSAASTAPGSTTWSPPTIRSWPTDWPTRSRSVSPSPGRSPRPSISTSSRGSVTKTRDGCAIFDTIVSLEGQTDTIVEAADALEVDLNLS